MPEIKSTTVFSTKTVFSTEEDGGGYSINLQFNSSSKHPFRILVSGPFPARDQSYSMDINEAKELFDALADSLRDMYQQNINMLDAKYQYYKDLEIRNEQKRL